MNAGWSLDNRMTVVLFAGMGGGCDGLEQAGFPVHLAINHDPVAIAVHEKRHPHTMHLKSDVFEVNPREACKGRGVRVLHASPDCRHFSVAKGSKPVSKRVRSLPWVVCRWGGQVRPETITLENVYEITGWGPLIAKRDKATGRVLKLDGSVAAKGERVPIEQQWLVPDPRHKGRTWRDFVRHINSLGYSFEWRKMCFADFGVPTIQTRLVGVMQSDGSPIVWPERTHAPRKDAKRLGLKPWVGVHTIIDWSLPVKSIFGRKKPLAEATLRRIARGVMRYVVEAPKPFIVPITHTRGSNGPRSVDLPLSTITTAKGGENIVVVPSLGEMRGTSVVRNPDEPLAAVSAGGGHAHLILAFLQQYYGTGGMDQPTTEPLHAITAKARRGLVEVKVGRETRVLGDIGIRMLEPEEGAAAHGFGPNALPAEIVIDGVVRRLTKTEKYHLVGNSVPPEPIRLLAALNVRQELMVAAE